MVEWWNGGNGGTAERMAEYQYGRNGYIRTIYGRHTPTTTTTTTTTTHFNLNGGMAEWREWQYGGKNGRLAEWQKWLHTYYLRYTDTDDDDNDDDDNNAL